VSVKHPIIVITGSSGAGTSTVRTTFEEIFRREGVTPAIVKGDAFHRYDRENMQRKMIEKQRQGYANLSHFGSEANLCEELEALFREYGERGCGKVRRYLHNEDDARPHGREIRTPDSLLPKEVDGVTRWFNSSMG
jgi:phosphoribulokinase